MKTVAKIVLSVIAIAVLFLPVVGIQRIEDRSITHAYKLEGMYVNGTALEVINFDNDTIDNLEDYYFYATPNYTTNSDSAIYFSSPAVLRYNDRATYIGNGTYTLTYNISDEPTGASVRKMYIPLNMNCTEFLEPDFFRIYSNWQHKPIIIAVSGTLGATEIGVPLREIEPDTYLLINTIQTRSALGNYGDAPVYLYYEIAGQPTETSWQVKIQAETYTDVDIFTWSDESLYIVTVLICDIVLIMAIVFASDPIDIQIEKNKWRR